MKKSITEERWPHKSWCRNVKDTLGPVIQVCCPPLASEKSTCLEVEEYASLFLLHRREEILRPPARLFLLLSGVLRTTDCPSALAPSLVFAVDVFPKAAHTGCCSLGGPGQKAVETGKIKGSGVSEERKDESV